MASRRKKPGGPRARAPIEWVGGLIAMPGEVHGEGAPYRPEGLFWLSSEGAVLGHHVGRPDTLLAEAADSLRTTIARPHAGPPHTPDRVRVDSSALARALEGAVPAVEIVCAPTPELDVLARAMEQHLGAGAQASSSYLTPEIGAPAMASFFAAAAALFRAQPWRVVPNDRSLFAVTLPNLDWTDLVLSVMGGGGEAFGFILFRGLDEYEEYLAAAATLTSDAPEALPPHFVLEFERGAELSTELRKEIAVHGWEVASAEAYPRAVAVDSNLTMHPPSAEDLTMVEAIARALVVVLEGREALTAAWAGGPPVERTLTVPTHAGDLQVEVRVPYAQEAPAVALDPSVDLLAELTALARVEGGLDSPARSALEEALLRRFAASPEARALPGVSWSSLFMSMAAFHHGATIATLSPIEMRALVFGTIPRKVSVEPAAATAIIRELRALYGFLGRELGLPQAAPCQRLLGGTAARRLEAALGSPERFGLAKSILMQALLAHEGLQVVEAAGPGRAKRAPAAKKEAPAKEKAPAAKKKAPAAKKKAPAKKKAKVPPEAP